MLLLSKRLKEARKAKKMTQEALGKEIGVTKVSICCYENGSRTPTLDTLIDLANALGVEITYLLGIDKFEVADNDEQYGINLAKEEILLIKELRKDISLYERILEDPKRSVELIKRKLG